MAFRIPVALPKRVRPGLVSASQSRDWLTERFPNSLNFALILPSYRPNRPTFPRNLCIRKALTNKAVNDD